jgi:hypothetical protein
MFPRWLIESGLGVDAVRQVLGGDSPGQAADPTTVQLYQDQSVSDEQVREIANRSTRRFWLCGDWIREQPMSISDVTARRLTAAEALALIGPIGLDEVREKASFSVKWRDRGWGK